MAKKRTTVSRRRVAVLALDIVPTAASADTFQEIEISMDMFRFITNYDELFSSYKVNGMTCRYMPRLFPGNAKYGITSVFQVSEGTAARVNMEQIVEDYLCIHPGKIGRTDKGFTFKLQPKNQGVWRSWADIAEHVLEIHTAIVEHDIADIAVGWIIVEADISLR